MKSHLPVPFHQPGVQVGAPSCGTPACTSCGHLRSAAGPAGGEETPCTSCTSTGSSGRTKPQVGHSCTPGQSPPLPSSLPSQSPALMGGAAPAQPKPRAATNFPKFPLSYHPQISSQLSSTAPPASLFPLAEQRECRKQTPDTVFLFQGQMYLNNLQ